MAKKKSIEHPRYAIAEWLAKSGGTDLTQRTRKVMTLDLAATMCTVPNVTVYERWQKPNISVPLDARRSKQLHGL